MEKNNILVLGDGFLGNAFKRHGYEVWGRNRFNWTGNKSRDTSHLMNRIGDIDYLINTIGISDTRFCEDVNNWDLIHSVNGILPSVLSKLCREKNTKFVHISTGCLYDTLDIPQSENAFRAAHCNYVVSKWIGEIGCNMNMDLIIRPRLLFDSECPAAGKRNNLLCKMEKFDFFINEHNSITSNDTIIEAIEALLINHQSGIFNVAQLGCYSISEIAEYLGLNVKATFTQDQLRKNQGLALVNNIMDLSKLRQFYKPRDTLVEAKRCWDILHETP